MPLPPEHPRPTLEEVLVGILEAEDEGRAIPASELVARYPHLEAPLREHFAARHQLAGLAAPLGMPAGGETHWDYGRAGGHESHGPGTVLGPYRIDRRLGQGGMGVVYLATHLHLGRAVALKVLPAKLERDELFVDRFRREARALAQLDHPNIVRIHDMGVHQGNYFFAMEHVAGPNLRTVVASRPLAPREALELFPPILDALRYAHEQGIVHRDIKPENILLTRRGVPKVADFGLARIVRGDAAQDNRTRSGVIMGSPSYMAPEQMQTSLVDHRADLFAVGVVLYELLTGELPVGNFRRPSERPGVDPRLDAIVGRALATRPDDRFQSATEFASEVKGVLESWLQAPAQSVLAAEAAELRVITVPDEEELGCGATRRLLIHASSGCDLELKSWSRPEVGLFGAHAAPKVTREGKGASERLKIKGRGHGLVVSLPPGLEVEVHSPYASVRVRGLQADLTILRGDGDVSIDDHRGTLVVDRAGGDGSVDVNGLDSSHFEIETGDGELTVGRLVMTEGQARVRSEEGSVYVGIDTSSSVAYDAMAHEGRVDGGVGDVARQEEGALRGALGSGSASLSISSGEGDVLLVDAAELPARREVARQQHDEHEFGQTLTWLGVATAAAWFFDWEFLAWCLCAAMALASLDHWAKESKRARRTA